ncbi:MAG: hypothetical protein M1814_005071 [Vezdaea aestivalis]|nr:MAG: hypothetical protein M1814_005071 [Vezdaea aestivalis]
MKTDFRFSNLLGTVYCQGNLLFTPDGNCLLSPVGNRVSVFDLINNRSYTLPFAHRKNVSRLALTPQGNLLLSIDDDGKAILTNFRRRIAIHHFSFRSPVSALRFSPSGKHFIVGVGRFVEAWQTPSTPDTSQDGALEYAPFVKYRVYAGHYDQVQSLQWSSDCRFFLSASKDLTARIWSLDPEDDFTPTTLAGHREVVQGAWFSSDQETVYTLSRDGALFRWRYTSFQVEDENDMDEGRQQWRIISRNYFMQNNSKITCATFHAARSLLVVGFSSGVFGLYDLPDFNMIHNLSISQNDIDFVTINQTGEWLAFGASKLGQLLVWEWQSESYILKQQGHYDSINAISYSPSGAHIITCADDGKIKLWDIRSGFCIVTFTEHTSGVTACEYARRGNVLFTASLDGSIRAWDLIRYRNFRTFTAPSRLSFSSLAVDPSGEIVCAGSLDSFDIHIWSVQTGQFLDQLSGHEGPVSSLAFSPTGGTLVSGSWDHTARMWSIFGRTQTSEPLQLQADVLCVAFHPDSKQVAVSTLDGQLTFWSVDEALQSSGIDGRRDISGGRRDTDRRTAANAAGTKSFATVRYSADGNCVLAGGNSKFICIYECEFGVLLKKFTVSVNLALSGTQEFLNSKSITEAGPMDLIDQQGEASDLEDRLDKSLPGVKKNADPSVRQNRPEIRVPAIEFSPTGRTFCAASTEGLLIYSLDHTIQFDPFDLDIETTPATTLAALREKNYLKAMVMAFRLNENLLVQNVYEGTPIQDIRLVVGELPSVYIAKLMQLVCRTTDDSPHLEFNLMWIQAILSTHGDWIQDNRSSLETELRSITKTINQIQAELTRLADDNVYTIDYLLFQKVSRTNENGQAKRITNGSHQINHTMMSNGRGESAEDEWMGLSD